MSARAVGRDLLHLGAFLLLLAALLIWWFDRDGTLFFTILDDPAGLGVYVPFQLVNTELWSEGAPLWNPWSGCGTPHLANLQSAPFYPLNVLFLLLPPRPAAEVLFVLRLALCGGACYALGRSLRLSRGGALFLALAFTLNNFELRFANLGNLNSDLLMPLSAIAYLRLGATGRTGPALWAVLLTGLHVLGGMPESAAFTFLFVALLYLFAAFLGEGRAAWGGPVRKLATLAVVFGGGAALAAVQVLPFLEYLGQAWSSHNGETHTGLWGNPIRFLPSLVYPFLDRGMPDHSGLVMNKTQLTLGAAGLFFGLRGLLRPLRGGLNLFLALIGLLAVMKLFMLEPVQSLGRLPILQMLAFPRYMIAPLLLGLSLVAALGFDEWLAGRDRTRARWLWLVAAPLTVWLWLRVTGGIDLEARGAYPWALLGITVALGLLGAWHEWRPGGGRGVLLGAIVLLLTGEMWLHFAQVPAHLSQMENVTGKLIGSPRNEVVAALGERMGPEQRLAFTGTNQGNVELQLGPQLAFGYRDAIYVERFWNYRSAVTGVEIDSGSISVPLPMHRATHPLLDLAAVDTVVLVGPSQRGQAGRELSRELPAEGFSHWEAAEPPRFVRRPKGALAFMASTPFTGELEVLLQGSDTLQFGYGRKIGALGEVHFTAGTRVGGEREVLFEGVFPAGKRAWRRAELDLSRHAGQRVTVWLRAESPEGAPVPCGFSDLLLPTREGRLPSSLRLVSRSVPFSVYAKENALPRAYVAHAALVAEDSLSAVALLSAPGFVPGHTVVLEEPPPFALPNAPFEGSSSVRIVESRARRVALEVEAAADGVLVLSDTYYPGWKARVDGESRRILPANGMFRGVPLERGRHLVEFSYAPWSFRVGAALSLLTLALILALAVRTRRSGRRGGG